jgi:hypothetical protein
MTKILIGNINSVNRINKMGEPPPPPKKKTNTILPEQFQNLIKKNVESDKIDTPNTHDCTLAWQ